MILIGNPYQRFKQPLCCGDTTELVVVICRNGVRQYRLYCSKHGIGTHNIAYHDLKRTEMANARVHHSNAGNAVERALLLRMFEPY